MTGSLKAEPLHAVPAAPLGLMRDQWAVDSANRRTVQQIHRKAYEHKPHTQAGRHMKAHGVHGNKAPSSDSGTEAC